ncbi:MAG: dihydroxyacetone kinase subunit L, partial [Okeania sp. SIO3B3]|nr:dihydroxyacetone kinase subunit L [Okeania sp. SIO3B3]
GDADHGINMTRGFKKAMQKLPALADKDIGHILHNIGMILVSSIGGASGPLYGTFFLRSGSALKSKEELTTDDLYTSFQAGVDGIKERGRAQIGDKTMYDLWVPALAALKNAADNKQSPETALWLAIIAAEQALKDTIPLQAKKGRASYLGERSIGHQDAGATSSYLMLKTLLDTVTAES